MVNITTSFIVILLMLAHEEKRFFPTFLCFFSKFDAKMYAMGNCFLFTRKPQSIYNNPANLDTTHNISMEGSYVRRTPDYEYSWGKDIGNFCQFIGLTHPYKKYSFGIAYSLLCEFKDEVPRDNPKYYPPGLFNESILRSFLIGIKRPFGAKFCFGVSTGLIWGRAEFPDKFKSEWFEKNEIMKYFVKGMQGILGMSYYLTPKFIFAIRIASPIFLIGKYEYKIEWYEGTLLDSSYYYTAPVESWLFYPCYVSAGFLFTPSKITKFTIQGSFQGGHHQLPYPQFREEDDDWKLNLNLGIERNVFKFFSLRGGYFTFWFPFKRPEDHVDANIGFTGGIGLNFPNIEINVSIGLEWIRESPVHYMAWGQRLGIIDITYTW